MNCLVSKSSNKCYKNATGTCENDEEIIKRLHSDSSRYASLLYIRTKLIKKQDGVKKLCELGGVKQLLKLMEKPKLTDIVLSILANCCLDNEVRTLVLSYGGAKTIARVFQCLASESVQNRACRALANLGLTPQGSKAINKEDVIGPIVKFLSSTKTPESQQTAVRALRILGDIPSHRLRVVQEEGLLHMSELLESQNEEVLKCCTKSLAWLTQHCSIEGALQVHRGQGLNSLVKLCDHCDIDVRENAFKILVNLCGESGIRPELGNAGVIPVLIKYVQGSKDFCPSLNAAVNALCLCCREAVNRVRIRDEGGLQTLMNLLNSDEHEELHPKIIFSLLAFRYDEAGIDVLLDLKLVPTLVTHLDQFVRANKKEHFLNNSDEESIGAPEIALKLNDYLNGLIQNSKAALDEVTTVDSLRDEKFDLLSDKNSDTEYESDDGIQCQSLQHSNSVSKVFCIHSPSYQQVQSEMQSGVPFLDTYSSRETYCPDIQSPTSSTSYCLSPDCSSPVSWGSPSSPPFWSPAVSPSSSSQHNWSPVLSETQSIDLDASPLQSPSMDDFCYSPVCEQNFSEDENDPDLEEEQENSDDVNVASEISSQKLSNQSTCSCVHSAVSENQIVMRDDQRGPVEPVDNEAAFPSTSTGLLSHNILVKANDLKGEYYKSSPKGIPLKRRRSAALEPLKRNRRDIPNQTSSFVSTGSGSGSIKPNKQPSEDLTSGGQIIQILSHLSQMEKPCTLLATEACITSIVDYVSLLPSSSPRAERVLSRLTRNNYCYESLVNFGIVRLLQQKLRPRHLITACGSCNQLQILQKKLLTNLSMASESGYGLGVLSYALLNGSRQEKINCILAIPYLVRGQKLLQKLMFECGGLTLLLKMFDPNHPNFKLTVEAVCQLCRQWIKPTSIPLKKTLMPPQCAHVCRVLTDVYFSLDDGSKMGANRAKLCQNSPFFSAMLEGSFMESAQNELKLPQVSEPAFQIILHFLYRCPLSSCTKLQGTNTDTLLELIALSDRFLMHDLRDDIIKKIIGGFCAESIGEIYMHSLRYDWEELRQSILRQLLVGAMDQQERILCFQKLLLLEDHFRCDLKALVSDNFPERQQKSYTPQDTW